MDFRQLQSFVAVVQYGSFTTAAAKLHISQPTVSTHVRMLEEELGKPLVLRTAKRVDLTAGGRKVYEQAVSVLVMYDRILHDGQTREKETIYIGTSSIPSAYLLPEALAEFGESHSEVRFVVSQDDSQAVIEGLIDGLFDIGFVGMEASEDTLECVPFCSDRIVIATANTDHFRNVDPDNAEEVLGLLQKEHIILRKSGSATRAVADRILEEAGLDEDGLNVIARLNDQEAIKNLVECGLGITLISECAVADRLNGQRMLTFAIPNVDTQRHFHILRRKNSHLDSCSEEFFAFMRLRFSDNM